MENGIKFSQKKKKKFGITINPAIFFLDVYPTNLKILIHKSIGTPIFIAAIFTEAKIWKQPQQTLPFI